MSRLLMLLVAVDAISKLGALLLLPEDRLVQLDALFQFALQKNETGVGTWGRTVFARLSWSETLAGAIGGLGLAVALIVMRKRRLGFWRRSAIAMAVGVASAMLTRPAAEALVKFSQPLSILALRVGALVVIGMIWWIAPAGFFKLGATLELAAGLGNLLSLLYPPFRVVDFMYSRLTVEPVATSTIGAECGWSSTRRT